MKESDEGWLDFKAIKEKYGCSGGSFTLWTLEHLEARGSEFRLVSLRRGTREKR